MLSIHILKKNFVIFFRALQFFRYQKQNKFSDIVDRKNMDKKDMEWLHSSGSRYLPRILFTLVKR